MLFPWIPIMDILWVILVMAKCGHMSQFGHMAIFGPNQNGPKYAHVGYPEREHKKTNSPVKKIKSFGCLVKKLRPKNEF